ncbi:hypothetical protein HXX76_001287 [Chlamydomonas incerta]|uniref:Uncharacterized protein n=1 Tax=Chlamydomonas incerta TaxID=51695 RepID=A0A835WBY7_CHLIN|nr:hypothetical protein HXX76_001287 [Chlamydomonas incerta]|eukprot:KAG2444541.1 hypothetical protein HXX76_001287 [Chlamydomonas incerta]
MGYQNIVKAQGQKAAVAAQVAAAAAAAVAREAWLITCGAVYLLLLRPRMFAERDERKRHMEREAAEYAKYEEDWDRLVARYQAKGEGPGAKGGAPAKPAAQQQLR